MTRTVLETAPRSAAPPPARPARSPLDRGMSWLIRGQRQASSHLLLLPTSVWLFLFLLVPLALLLAVSFARRGPYGSIAWDLTLDNYSRAFSPEYLPILVRSLTFASLTTLACLLLGYPFAYYLALVVRSPKVRTAYLVALMLPFWTSSLVQIYCWMIILGREGLLNNALTSLGALTEPMALLNTPGSVLFGLTYFYLPFMVLPLYSSLSKLPRSYIEAAKDLGAGNIETFVKITFPLSLPGVVGGAILTFIPCVGDFLTAEFLGGPRTYLVGNLIQNQFTQAGDYPFGAALSAVLITLLVGGLAFWRWFEAKTVTRLGRARG